MDFHKEVWYCPFGIVCGLSSCVYTWTVHPLMNSPWLLVYHVTCKLTHRLSRHSTFWSLFGYPPAFISLSYKLCQSGQLPLLLPLDSHSWSPGSILPHPRSPPSLGEARWLPVPVRPIWPMWTLAVTVPLSPFISLPVKWKKTLKLAAKGPLWGFNELLWVKNLDAWHVINTHFVLAI